MMTPTDARRRDHRKAQFATNGGPQPGNPVRRLDHDGHQPPRSPHGTVPRPDHNGNQPPRPPHGVAATETAASARRPDQLSTPIELGQSAGEWDNLVPGQAAAGDAPRAVLVDITVLVMAEAGEPDRRVCVA